MSVSTRDEFLLSAELRTNISGWVCKSCSRYFGDSERGAQYCCTAQSLCKCGEVSEPGRLRCAPCNKQFEAERWAELYATAIPWDGKTPLYSESVDRYFFSEEDLTDYLDDLGCCDEDEPFPQLADLKLRLCTQYHPAPFELMGYLEDYISDEEDPPDTAEIDEQINAWLKKKWPKLWTPDGPAVTTESLPRLEHE